MIDTYAERRVTAAGGLIYDASQSSACLAGAGDLKTILFINNHAQRRIIAQTLFGSISCDVAAASHAEGGSEYLYGNFKDVVLTLSDIDLPGMSGLEFLTEIKQQKHLKKIPVIVQNGRDKQEKKRALKLASSAFLRKPHTRGDLFKAACDLNINFFKSSGRVGE